MNNHRVRINVGQLYVVDWDAWSADETGIQDFDFDVPLSHDNSIGSRSTELCVDGEVMGRCSLEVSLFPSDDIYYKVTLRLFDGACSRLYRRTREADRRLAVNGVPIIIGADVGVNVEQSKFVLDDSYNIIKMKGVLSHVGSS